MRSWLFVLCLLPSLSFAAEGMWTFDALPTAAIESSLGVKLTPEWVTKVQHGAARLSSGCSASFVSEKGLVLTNHHCVRGCISQLSKPGRDLLGLGFTARRPAQELECPALHVQQLTGMEDVTAKVEKAIEGKKGKARADAMRALKASLEAPCSEKAEQRCEVVSFFGGGRHVLYTYRRYTTVKLVWAPEFPTAAWGGYADNFHFPRFGLDAALLRVWENGKPATTPQALPIAREPLKAGDPSFVAGHPGGTERQVTVAQLTWQRDVVLPSTLVELAELRGLLLAHRATTRGDKTVVDARLRSIENGLKALGGRHRALGDPTFFAKLVEEEQRLRREVGKNPAQAQKVKGAWEEIEEALGTYASFRDEHRLFALAQAFPGELFGHARDLMRAAVERDKPDGLRLEGYTQAELPALEARLASTAPVRADLEALQLGFGLRRMRELLGADHPLVQRVLGREDPEAMAERLVKTTRLDRHATRLALLKGGMSAVAKSDDPMLLLAAEIEMEARTLAARYREEVETPIRAASQRISEARFAVDGTNVYPDANFTLRLSYGRVEGWTEGSASEPVAPLTTFGQALERATGTAPYALAPSWIRARSRIRKETPFNVSSSHDIIGGNSGSPLLNANGEVAGLVFDGNLHSLGGRYGYDAPKNRAVSVHMEAILESLRTIYRASHLADELVPPVAVKVTAEEAP